MDSKHTPGPWEIIPHTAIPTEIRAASEARHGARVAIVCNMGGPGASFWPEPEANARLIAAAPELLAALRDCLAWHNNPQAPDDCWSAASAALARAEG